MRFLLALLLLSFFSCSQQQDNSKLIVKDSSNIDPGGGVKPIYLPNLTPPDADLVKPSDYSYSIDITGPDYVVILNDQKTILMDDKVSEFLKKNADKIKGHVISIITSNKTTYRKTVDALDLVAINKIKNYKLVTKDTIR